MTIYKLKRGFSCDINRIKEVIVECFGESYTMIDNNTIELDYKFLKGIRISFIGKNLSVITKNEDIIERNEINISDEEVLEVNSKFRKFLYFSTGYTSKERIKHISKNEGKE